MSNGSQPLGVGSVQIKWGFLFWICLSFFAPSSLLLADSGKLLYEKKCSQCHGLEGKGDGSAAAFVKPKPRDFTLGAFKIRTTPGGVLPTDDDLEQIVSKGIPGTSMTAFENSLSKNEIKEIISYIKTFFPKFKDEKREAVKINRAPRRTKELVEKGKELYQKFGCYNCHGSAGRADGPSAPSLKDDKGDPIPPANLTKPWNFRGGGEVKDIFTRLTTGMSGTPMASFVGIEQDEKADEEIRWAISHYIKSLSDGHPNIKSVIPAQYFSGEIPVSFENDIALPWDQAEDVDLPLVGQVMFEPRLFVPSIDSVMASAVYNDREIVFRVRWDDVTKDSDSKKEKDRTADSLSVQFPLETFSGSELPYFLGGDESKPVQMLTWSADFDRITRQIYKGSSEFEDVSTDVKSQSFFDQGQWTLFIRIPLNPAGNSELKYKAGDFVPVAISAGDGSHNEREFNRSVSAWHHLLLQKPSSKMRFVWPAVTFAGTLGGEFLLLSWIRKKRPLNQ